MNLPRYPDPRFLGSAWSLRPPGAGVSVAAYNRKALERLDAATRSRKFRKGEIVATAESEWPFVGRLIRGSVFFSKVARDGRTQAVGLLFPPDVVGSPGGRLSRCEVVAATDVELLCISQRAFECLVEEMPQLLMSFLDAIADELQAAQDWILLLGRKTARERVASYLIHIARRAASAEPDETELVIDPILTRETIADLLGLTTETVSRQFSDLSAEGLIRRLDKGHIEIPDMWSLCGETGDWDPEQSGR